MTNTSGLKLTKLTNLCSVNKVINTFDIPRKFEMPNGKLVSINVLLTTVSMTIIMIPYLLVVSLKGCIYGKDDTKITKFTDIQTYLLGVGLIAIIAIVQTILMDYFLL
jgi:hypothetical protein